MLCAVCRSNFPSTWNINNVGRFSPGRYHTTQSALQAASDASCLICTKTLEVVRAYGLDAGAIERKDGLGIQLLFNGIYDFVGDDEPEARVPEGCYIVVRTTHGKSTLFEFAAIPVGTKGNDYVSMRTPSVSDKDTSANTGDDFVMTMGMEWLANCSKHHKLCKKLASNAKDWRPDRLLDLTDESVVRLVITSEDILKHREYATLSYCWGPNPDFLQLTTEQMPLFRSGIPLDTMPQTFQDAMRTARRLGIFNIWIDSLCIIQSGEDSLADWNRQCGLMEYVYENSTLNISALHGANPHAGLFKARDPRQFSSVLINKEPYMILPRDLYDELFSSPLLSRGWVFQERLLARRVLHFGKTQAFWECKEIDGACEDIPPGSTYHPFSEFSKQPFELDLRDTDFYDTRLQKRWNNILRQYTASDLSYPVKDKFVALSGIAKRMAALQKDDYVAGFFRKTLPDALCWRISESSRPWTGEFRAPTWSWANIEGRVIQNGSGLNDDCMESLASLVDVKLEYEDGHGAGGRLKAGSIVVRGALMQAFPLKPTKWDKRTQQFEFPPNVQVDPSMKAEQVLRLDSPEESLATKSSSVYYLAITSHLDDDGYTQIECLVLLDKQGLLKDSYSRIGHIVFYFHEYYMHKKITGLQHTTVSII